MSKKRSDTEVLNHFVTYEPPPRGFDPLTARAILLRKHGFPRRPRPEKERRLHELWQRAFSRPMKFIKAELAVARRDRPRPTGPCDLRGKWAGAVVNPASLFPPEPGAANFVYGQWILPSVVPPSNPPQGLPVGFWVGLGGVGAENSFNVVQAGTEAVVDGNTITYSAFTEWTPDFAVTVNNFPVDAGDHVEFLVCTPQPDRAFVSMRNFTSSVATNMSIQAPAGVKNDGTSAEWIVEGNGPQLMDFFSVTFGQCLGATPDRSFDLTTATTMLIPSCNGNTALAQAYFLLSNAVIVIWNNFGP